MRMQRTVCWEKTIDCCVWTGHNNPKGNMRPASEALPVTTQVAAAVPCHHIPCGAERRSRPFVCPRVLCLCLRATGHCNTRRPYDLILATAAGCPACIMPNICVECRHGKAVTNMSDKNHQKSYVICEWDLNSYYTFNRFRHCLMNKILRGRQGYTSKIKIKVIFRISWIRCCKFQDVY